jgi:cytidylate kinase
MTVITMPREMGSRGRDVAIGVAEALGLQILHHELVEERLAERMDIDRSAVHRYLEGTESLLDKWRLRGKPVDYYSAAELFDIAIEGNVVIRGWGATQLLGGVGHVLALRVCAPMTNRVDTVLERMDLTDRQAVHTEIVANDNLQERVVGRLSRIPWNDSLHFDLVLNSSRLSIAECVQQVVRLTQTPQYARQDGSISELYRARDTHQKAAIRGETWAATHSGRPSQTERPVLRENQDLV